MPKVYQPEQCLHHVEAGWLPERVLGHTKKEAKVVLHEQDHQPTRRTEMEGFSLREKALLPKAVHFETFKAIQEPPPKTANHKLNDGCTQMHK